MQGVGLKLEDALAFWKAEFSQRVSMVLFEVFYMFSFGFCAYAYSLYCQLQVGNKWQLQMLYLIMDSPEHYIDQLLVTTNNRCVFIKNK